MLSCRRMPLIAITREVSPSINRCEISFQSRQPIDFHRAVAEHRAYQNCLEQLGVQILSLPVEPELPDSVFVEDAAVVVGEVAVIPIMGAESRRPETATVASVLSAYREIRYLQPPATLDGGDVMAAGKRLFVGLTARTNAEAVSQLRKILLPHGYTVHAVGVRGVLHLKSACSYLGNGALLINRHLLEKMEFSGCDLIDLPSDEPAAANALVVNKTVILAAAFPKTADLLGSKGFRVIALDVCELQKAEAGVTCCSLIFEATSTPPQVAQA